jgi:CRP-like cAMP-binding protein
MTITLLTELATLDAFGRVAGRLCHLAEVTDALYLDSSQEDLAMMANVSWQTVNKVVAELAKEGAVRRGYGNIHIKDLDALKLYRDSHRRRP